MNEYIYIYIYIYTHTHIYIYLCVILCNSVVGSVHVYVYI